MADASLSLGTCGAAVANLQRFLAQQGATLPASEVDRAFFGSATRQAIAQFQQKNSLPITGTIDAKTTAAIAAVAATTAPSTVLSLSLGSSMPVGAVPNTGDGGAAPGGASFAVSGRVSSNSRAGLGGLRVVIVDKNVGADVPLAQGVTVDGGTYQVAFTTDPLLQASKAMPDLQARVYVGDSFLAASDVRYNTKSPAVLDVLLPDTTAGLPTEYESLTAALTANYKGSLTGLQESGERQDITYLANKTGWDARAVAMAALAAQFSNTPAAAGQAAANAIAPAFFYALFRAGLPVDPDSLYLVKLSTVKAVWQNAIAQGVIPSALAPGIDAAARAFQSLSAAKALTALPPVGISTRKELLQLSLPNDLPRQQIFANLYTQYQDDLPSFWTALQKSLGAAATQRLQLDGQLGYLTLNNAALIAQLHQAQGRQPLAAAIDLAKRGYHRADKWLSLLTTAIPAEIAGASLDEQRTNYAELLARHVRLAFPTAVVAEMVSSGAVPMKAGATIAPGVSQFLTDNQGKFEIGAEPVDAYLSRSGLAGTVPAPVVAEVKRLQRVYQITPNDQAFTVLLQNNLDSAYAITRYDSDGFVRVFGDAMGGATIAAQTYAKARQVHGAVINIVTSFVGAHVAPPLGRNVQGYILDSRPTAESIPSNPVVAYPTLQGLLGSMDFCACDDCRSIASPAAYLVNLLQFIHCRSPQIQDPQSVLFARRPDLKYLPLTCENTNVALPYIDLVNETLEYFVANSLSIANYQGHDTGSTISSDELMASPQYVNDAAYATLQTAWFPPPLPFHRPLALLRLHFQKFGVPLQDAMAALRQSDAIERNGPIYGWRDILMEEVGFSLPEYRILTDSTLKLQDLYGYPSLGDAAVISNLSGMQDFSRRAGVSYDDIFAILRTRFINPQSVLIPRLQPLNVPFTTIRALKGGAMTPSDFKALLPANLDARAYGATTISDFDAVVQWLTNSTNYSNIMGLITISNPVVGKITVGGSFSSPQPLSGTVGGAAWSYTTDSSGDLAAAASGIASAINAVPAISASYLAFSAGAVVRITPKDQATDQSSFAIAATGTGTLALTSTVLVGEDLCSSVELQFRYANPDNTANVLRAIDFVRLIRFIRLWRKLGLSIEQTDDIITALYPAAYLPGGVNDAQDLQAQDAGFLKMLPRIGFLFQVLDQLQLTADHALASLLAGWSSIGVSGDASLYAKMFLTPTVLQSDPDFAEDPYGNVLQDNSKSLLDHAETLRAAFNLTAAEFAAIVATLSSTILNLANISAIYRVGWIARTLQISVLEFLALTSFTGLDPFAAPPDPSPTPPAEPAIIRLVRLVQSAKTASLQPFQMLYLIWNQDISGLSTPPDSSITGLAATLRADFAAVESQFLLVDDPNGDIAKSLMELVYGATATDFFLGLLNNTVTTSVAYGNPQPTLAQQILDAASGRLSYDDLRKQLTFGGVLDATTLAAIQAAITANGNYAPLLAAVNALSVANHQLVDPFFSTYPELGPAPGTPYGIYVASSDPAPDKRKALLANLLVDLKSRRKQEQALAAVAAAAGVDIGFGNVLLTDAGAMLAAGGTGPAVSDLTAIEAQGLSTQFFLTNNPQAAPDQVIDAAAVLDYEAGGTNPLPAGSGGGPIAATWSGFVSAPQDGDYNIQITTDPAANVSLGIGGTTQQLVLQSPGVWRNSAAIPLIAGSLTAIMLAVNTVKNRVTVTWESASLGWQVIPGASLYSATAMARLRTTYIRFLKATSLSSLLSLTANETAWLAKNGDLAINGSGWLNALAVSGAPDALTSAALRDVLSTVLDFARLKLALSPKDERLLSVLQNPAAVDANLKSTLLVVTGWTAESRDALLQQFFGNTALTNLEHVENFRRVYDAYAKVTTCGIAAAPLIAATTNEPAPSTVAKLQSALRAL
jgi:peptidoglycan hydrolase-like protein with peptidoglycan-binding domain